MFDDEIAAEMQAEEGDGPASARKGALLAELGLNPEDLAGKIIVVAAYKGGVGKTLFAYELALLLDAVLADFDWDDGNATVQWGYNPLARKGAPLLDAIERGKTPEPLTGGPWRPDLVPCHPDFEENQPDAQALQEDLLRWAAEWGEKRKRPVVVDTHPGGSPSTLAAMGAANVIVVPVVLEQRPMKATEGMARSLAAFPLLLVPNMVGSPSDRFIKWLGRIAKENQLPVGPSVGKYPWVGDRKLRMAITAKHPTPKRAELMVEELERVGKAVVKYVRTAG